MCIYLPNSLDLTYNSREHIIPKGLGGIIRLPKGCVSDQFNEWISVLEGDFMRNSIISFPRSIEGPGKEGSLSEAKSTKSKVSIIQNTEDRNKFSLGYVALGRAYHITHFSFNIKTGYFNAGADKSIQLNDKEHFHLFFERCRSENIGRTVIIIDEKLPDSLILFGITENHKKEITSYFAKNTRTIFDFSSKKIKAIASQIDVNSVQLQNESYKPEVALVGMLSENEHFRIYAKIAFNSLAYCKGKDFVLDSCFDSIRNWITFGGDNSFAKLDTLSATLASISIPFPKSAHVVLINRHESNLLAAVFLYGALRVNIALSTSFTNDFGELEGYICDWKNKKEYKYCDYIRELEK